MSKTRILVVDDDRRVVEIVRLYLQKEGLSVTSAGDGETALQRFRELEPDLIVLDIMLPGRDGWEVCREIRRTSSVPIIMLTARDDDTDKIVGLELGADDYLTKPFNPRELVARIKAILRRLTEHRPEPRQGPGRAGDLEVDLASYTVTVKGKPVHLTPRETELLWFLARGRGQVFSRETLLREVWGYEYTGDGRTVDTHIKRLRQKLPPSEGWSIDTVWGVGYRLRVEEDNS